MALRADERPTPILAIIAADTDPAAPLPHEQFDDDGLSLAFARSADWANTLVAKLAARDQDWLDTLDLPAHEHAIAERTAALLAVVSAGERHLVTRLLLAFAARERSTATQVATFSWEVGYAYAVQSCTGAAPEWRGMDPNGEFPA